MEYFTFEIDGKPAGYYQEEDKDGVFFCNAFISMQGDTFENPFWVKYNDGKVLAYKFADGDYMTFRQAADVYPTSAFFLLVRQVADQKQLTYKVFNEGKGVITGDATLKRHGNRVEEIIGGKVGRYAILKDGNIVEYGWGGTAKSKKVASIIEAKKDPRLSNRQSKEPDSETVQPIEHRCARCGAATPHTYAGVAVCDDCYPIFGSCCNEIERCDSSED